MTGTLDIVEFPQARRSLALPRGAREDEDRLDLATLATTLRRRIRLFATVMIAVMLAALVLTLTREKQFTATAQLVLNMPQEQITPREAGTGALPPMPLADRADTEVQVLKSRALADRVATSLDLVNDAGFNPARAGRPPGIATRILRLTGLKEADAPPSPAQERRIITDRLLESLTVTRLDETFAMDVAITTNSPRNAERIANAYARLYTEGQREDKADEHGVATTFLARRLEELRAQAHADTERVQQYRISHNLFSTSGASLTEQEISSYNQAVAQARAQAVEDRARLGTARGQLRSGSNGGDVGEALGSPVVNGLRTQQAEVSGRYATLRARYSEIHPEVRKARMELADIDERIQAEIGRVISNLEAKARVSAERLDSISGSLSTARGSLAQNNLSMVGLDDLQRRAEASQGLYESYLGRYKQIAAQGGTERPDATIISAAEMPDHPSSPHVGLNMVLGTLIGIGAGLGAAFMTEMFFAGLTTGEEVEQKLGIPYLTGVPMLSSRARRAQPGDNTTDDPKSMFAESFRSLRTSLRYVLRAPPKLIVVTSALPKEGKTTVATCLARTLVRDGASVVLVDCDLGQPRLSRRLGGDRRESGLVEYLEGGASLEQVLMPDQVSGVQILPVVRAHSGKEDLLSGERMAALLATLRERFTHVVVDTAPILPIAETRILAAMADAVVIVTRWRHTPDHAVKAALRLLSSKHVTVAGLVLNQMDVRKQTRFGHGDAAYYYNAYKSYYK